MRKNQISSKVKELSAILSVKQVYLYTVFFFGRKFRNHKSSFIRVLYNYSKSTLDERKARSLAKSDESESLTLLLILPL